MAKKTKLKEPAPAKKLYLIRADDVRHFEFTFNGVPFEIERIDDLDPEDRKKVVITAIVMAEGGRIVQIDDNPEGRGILTANIRRAVGEKATTRLISGGTKTDKSTN